jgi:hypothetical protein
LSLTPNTNPVGMAVRSAKVKPGWTLFTRQS